MWLGRGSDVFLVDVVQTVWQKSRERGFQQLGHDFPHFAPKDICLGIAASAHCNSLRPHDSYMLVSVQSYLPLPASMPKTLTGLITMANQALCAECMRSGGVVC